MTYFYRRSLSPAEHIPALGAGLVIGAAAFYLARLLLQRTPLRPDDRIAMLDEGERVVHRTRRERPAR